MALMICVAAYFVSAGQFLDAHAGAITAIATGVIGIFSFTLWHTNRQQLRHSRVVERAYVKLSHIKPGLTVKQDGKFWVQIKAKNFGQTPARVTDILLKPLILPKNEKLPNVPDYNGKPEKKAAQAFLVANDSIFHTEIFTTTAEAIKAITEETHNLWLFGYVDYIDAFGTRHRGGYMRCYKAGLGVEENNLHFVDRPGYNYDRPRRPGEGDDWSKTQD